MLDNSFGIFDNLNNHTLETARKELLGRGIKYPVSLNEEFTKDLELVDDVSVINQSISLILKTRRGERFFLPNFGTDIHRYLFEPNVFISRDLIKDEIVRAIQQWEPRVTNVRVDFSEDGYDSEAKYIVTYTIISSSQLGEFIYTPDNYITE